MSNWRDKLHEIIFEADTKEGKAFDVALLIVIILSVIVVTLESVKSYSQKYGDYFTILEWTFTALFVSEYILRILCLKKPIHYIFSFLGIIDLLSILPNFIGLFFVQSHSLIILRTLRLLRVFRIFKLVKFVGEAKKLIDALKASRHKIIVFIVFILANTVVMGTFMYLVEGEENGFTSIPRSMYWAIVTLTTVGYGDIAPQTVLGQTIASIIMIMGYGVIAVPTGIVSVEIAKNTKQYLNTISCSFCGSEGHESDSNYCKDCGNKL